MGLPLAVDWFRGRVNDERDIAWLRQRCLI
jgi:hypothetical protein